MSTGFFGDIKKIKYEGPDSTNPLAYRFYNPDEVVAGKRLEDHLRFAVAYWHSFAWPGGDPFGGQTFERPWFGDTMEHAKLKADVAFEMFSLLGAPYFCFHDADVRPEGKNFAESAARLDEIADYFAGKMKQTGVKLLWGTANLFSQPPLHVGRRDQSRSGCVRLCGRDGEDTAWTSPSGSKGENYVLWGGREGYETLLNTDLKREQDQAGRFLNLVVDYKHKIGFKGTILIEPKPQEPTKHQYDYDVATVYGFLKTLRAGEGGQGQYRAGPRDPRRPFLRARAGAGQRARHLRLDRHEPQRLPVGLGHRPVPQQRAGDGARLLPGAAGRRLQDRRHQFRRQAAPPVARSRGPADRPYRRHGLLRARPEGGGQDDRGQGAVAARSRSAMPAGTSAEAQGDAVAASARWRRSPSAWSKKKIEPQPQSGRQELLENIVNRYV